MTSVSKSVDIDKLDDVVNEYKNTYQRAVKKKPIDIKSSTYIDFCLENNDKDPKFEVGYQVRKSKYKTIFTKCYASNWAE